ncbi:hypothetical protein ACJIZ3_002926 [Penstemon smallii]|uniref:Response regulatory domain-containing protein n=1 Tax=Penstemon smallii TaxID=265156 RepID=A0ABD3UBJ3_9LAMI
MNSNSELTDCKSDEKKEHFHVLAVDDSNIDRKLLERLLTVSSYEVTCVDSGDKALEYLGLVDNVEENHQHEFYHEMSSSSSTSSASSSKSSHQHQVSKVNLIMTDYSMPGISGYDLLKRVKESTWKDIPVVVMSSENVQSRINMCLEGGAEEFLLKPVKLSDLRKLHSHLLLKNSTSCRTHPTNPNINIIINDDDDDDDVDNHSEEKSTRNDTNYKEENDNNCTNSNNKRKAASASTTSSALSDRNPRFKELPVS